MKFKEYIDENAAFVVGYTNEIDYLSISWKMYINRYEKIPPENVNKITTSIFSKSCYERHYAKKK